MADQGITLGGVPQSDGLDEAVFGELRANFRGELLRSRDDGYDVARAVFNGMIDRRPALIARCTGVADVIATVNFARDNDLQVAVRGGGHSVPGYAVVEGGVVVDLSPMKGVWIDPEARVARAQAGLLWGELDRETQAFGLAVTGGRVSDTGIAGLTLGGGSGWLERKIGFTVDNLISADVVTADGRLVRASAEENEDLFWGLKGGGGNFGIVTSFEYRLHPVTQILGGLVLHPLDQARDVLRFYREFCTTLPDEAESYAALLTAPQGMPVVALLLGYNGALAEGEKVLEPARRFGAPLADLVGPMPYVARQAMLDAPNAEHGLHRYWRSAFADQISDEFIDALVEGAATFTSPLSALILFYIHGAATRPSPTETAFAARRRQWDFDAIGQWSDAASSDQHIRWVRALWARLEQHLLGKVYTNHAAAEDRPETIRASFGENYVRLQQVKAMYDPTNLFRLNPNISPV